MLAGLQLEFALRITTMIAPVATYFLILGLQNTRRHPQILSARLDFALLISALSPLFIVPILHYVGLSSMSLALAVAAVGAAVVLLAPRGRVWVVYNVSAGQADDAATRALRALGDPWRRMDGAYHVIDGSGSIRISGFPLLRNVSVHVTGSKEWADRASRELSGALGQMPAETSPSAVAVLLVATAMFVAPLTLIAHQAGEIARILTDLLN
jgi:hypothetical protein